MRWLTALMILAAGAAWGQDRVVAYRIVDASTIPDSLTGQPGDAEAGRKLYFDRIRTNCSGCHGSPSGPGAVRDTAAAAPDLGGVARRLTPGNLRLWIVAPQVLVPGTGMPAFYSAGQRTDPKDPRFGEPLLSAAEIENLVAYLVEAGQ